MRDETTECEGEIDGSGRGSLPKANALKRRETGCGNGRRETAASRDLGLASNRERKYGVWMRMGVRRLMSTRQETAGG